MHYKISYNILHIICIIITTILTTSCSILPQYISKQNFNISQGNQLTQCDIEKINLGMTKFEVFSLIGYPTLQDLFGSNIWYYIYYSHSCNMLTTCQTIRLEFDINDILISINNK